jgi:hypothetical protein
MSARERHQAALQMNDLAASLREREAAAELAAAEGDLDLEWKIRAGLVSFTYRYPVRRARISNYGWLVARADAEPERFQLNLWYYKWVIPDLYQTVAIDSVAIGRALDDFDRRLAVDGESKKPVLKLRAHAAAATGRLDDVETYLKLWQAAGRSGENDCLACDVGSHVSFLVALGRYSEALAVGTGMIAGSTRCGVEEPGCSMGYLSHAARQLGDDRLAEKLRADGLTWIKSAHSVLGQVGDHIRDAVKAGHIDQALLVVSENLERLESPTETDLGRLRFLSAVRLVSRLGGDIPDPAKLCAEAESLAAKFDRRNGNFFYADAFKQDDALTP